MGNEQSCCEGQNNQANFDCFQGQNRQDLNCCEDPNIQQQQFLLQQQLQQATLVPQNQSFHQQSSSRLNQSFHNQLLSQSQQQQQQMLQTQQQQILSPVQSLTFQQQIAATPRQDYNSLYQSQGVRAQQELTIQLQLSSNQTLPYHLSDPQQQQQLQQSMSQQLLTPPQSYGLPQVNPNQSTLQQPTVQQQQLQQSFQQQVYQQSFSPDQQQFQQQLQLMALQQQPQILPIEIPPIDQNQMFAKQKEDELNQQQEMEEKKEIHDIPLRQSLDEPTLPSLYRYFSYIKNGDSDIFNDPYHGEIYKFQSKLNPDFYLAMKVIVLSNFKQYEQKEQEYQWFKSKFTHPNLINIHLIHSKKFLCLWSSTFRICLLQDYITTNLWEISKVERLAEPQLWKLLDSVIDALQFLEQKKRIHGNITLKHLLKTNLFDGQVCYKLHYQKDEPKIINDLIKEKNSEQHPLQIRGEFVFVSPLVFKSALIKQELPHNQVKSDVFSLGMCIIYLALTNSERENVIKLYSMEHQTILDVDIILSKLRREVSKKFYGLLENMVRVNEDDRPNFTSVYEQLRQFCNHQVFSVDQPINYIYTVDLQKRQEEKISSSGIQKSNKKSQNKSLISPLESIIPIQPSHYEIPQKAAQKDDEIVIMHLMLSTNTPTENRHYDERSYPNGNIYKGQIKNGLRDGFGQMFYSDQTIYDGCWREDQFHGKGCCYNQQGVLIYEGNFVNGQYQQFGKLRNGKIKFISTEFDYTDFTKLGNKWIKYEGDFQNSLKHGFGTLELSNGEKLVCQFSQDLPSGVGVFTTLDKKTIKGQWNDGLLIRRL